MTATQTETLGYADNLYDLYTNAKDPLRRGGLDVDLMIATLGTTTEDTRAAHVHQESLKRELKAATRLAEIKLDRLYRLASSMTDMAMGAVEKTSDEAKNFQALRSRMRRHAKSAGTFDPTPIPVPPDMKTD